MNRMTLFALAPALLLLVSQTEEAFAQGIDVNAVLYDTEAPVSLLIGQRTFAAAFVHGSFKQAAAQDRAKGRV